MAKGMPSMVALLGLLAVAGYQNRDKLGSVLGGLGGNASGTGAANGNASGGLGDALGGMLGGAGAGGLGSILSGGLGDLMEQFNGSGKGAKVQSWVNDGDNEDIDTAELEQTLGADTIATLQQKTGLSKQDLLERLAKTLPDAVNRMTPDGRLPTEAEASRFV